MAIGTVNDTKLSSVVATMPGMAPGVRVGVVTAAASLHYAIGVWNRIRSDKKASLPTILAEQAERTANTFGLSSNPILREAIRHGMNTDRFVLKSAENLDNRLKLIDRQARTEK